jgi:hypothetical protein
VYRTCLRCERPFGTNAELPNLPIGRRIAFDTERGRIWVICRRCGQWNLAPLESRWEALEECERLAVGAEARAAGAAAGFARTRAGLELLRIGGMPDADILNWRYGRRLKTRQRLLWWIACVLAVGAVLLGIRALQATGVPGIGLYVAVVLGVVLHALWRQPPRLWLRLPRASGAPRVLWHWQLQDIRVERRRDGVPPVLIAPDASGRWRAFEGAPAAAYLAALLPRLNGSETAIASVPEVLQQVAASEGATATSVERSVRRSRRARRSLPRPLRPWEHLVDGAYWSWVTSAPAVARLALEVAVTEEVEAAALRREADALAAEWPEEEEIGAIADDLLLPETVRARLHAAWERRSSARDDQ